MAVQYYKLNYADLTTVATADIYTDNGFMVNTLNI